MTRITIFKKEDKIWAYKIKGHSGFAEKGEDIVCSGISVAGQMALIGLTEVLKLKVKHTVEDGYMQVEILENDFQNENAQVVLCTMEKTLESIAQTYPRNVKMEVKKRCL